MKLSLLLLITMYQANATQTLYNFIPDHCEVISVNPKLVSLFGGKCVKRSRTGLFLNVNFTLLVDIPSDRLGQLKITGYQFRSNEYRKGPIEFMMGFCTTLANKNFDIPHILKDSNLHCPLRKGHNYYAFNISPNATNFPPLIPEGKWMLELEFFFNNEYLMGALRWYAEVQYRIPIPSHV